MSEPEVYIRISPDGTVSMLGGDDIDPSPLGKLKVQRVSHVEFSEEAQSWYVFTFDRKLVCGAFKTRAEALAFERKWAARSVLEVPRVES